MKRPNAYINVLEIIFLTAKLGWLAAEITFQTIKKQYSLIGKQLFLQVDTIWQGNKDLINVLFTLSLIPGLDYGVKNGELHHARALS